MNHVMMPGAPPPKPEKALPVDIWKKLLTQFAQRRMGNDFAVNVNIWTGIPSGYKTTHHVSAVIVIRNSDNMGLGVNSLKMAPHELTVDNLSKLVNNVWFHLMPKFMEKPDGKEETHTQEETRGEPIH